MPAPQQTENAGIEVKIGNQRTVVHIDSFDGRDTKACRDETGHPPRYWFEHTDDWDIDIIAMLVWLVRRKGKPGLSYDDVLESINYDNVEVIGGAEDDEDDPEA